jgi:hypothetical protein
MRNPRLNAFDGDFNRINGAEKLAKRAKTFA